MKTMGLVFIALIGLYTFARNNLGVLPDQVMWISHPDIFYKVFIPLLMFTSATTALLKKDKINFLYLSFTIMFIDTINRLASIINEYYMYLTYDQPKSMVASVDTIAIKINYWPSYIMLFIEMVLILSVLRHIVGLRNIGFKSGS